MREELNTVNEQLIAALNTVQRLELRLIDAAHEASELNSQIRALEVSRDDAELRFLEAEDRTEKALAFVRTTFSNAGQLLQALEPLPEPERGIEPTPMVIGDRPLDSSSLPVDVAGSTGSNGSSEENGERPLPDATQDTTAQSVASAPSVESVIEGQGAADPTTNAQAGVIQQSAGQNPAAHSDVGSTDLASSQGSGPYTGKRYYDHAFYVSLQGWLAGGGTEESYNWRPSSVDLPIASTASHHS